MSKVLDIISSFTNSQFSGPVTIPMIITSLSVSFFIALFIVFIYRKTFSGIVYNRNISLSIILLAMITSMIIRTINSNLSLSLGMVGALSIVRFRTAIKEPVDTAYMFWAIAAGIMCGADLYLVAAIGSLTLGLYYYLSFCIDAKAKTKFLLVVIHKTDDAELDRYLATLKNKKLKSQASSSDGFIETTYEIALSDNGEGIISRLQTFDGVKTANLVAYSSDFGL